MVDAGVKKAVGQVREEIGGGGEGRGFGSGGGVGENRAGAGDYIGSVAGGEARAVADARAVEDEVYVEFGSAATVSFGVGGCGE